MNDPCDLSDIGYMPSGDKLVMVRIPHSKFKDINEKEHATWFTFECPKCREEIKAVISLPT